MDTESNNKLHEVKPSIIPFKPFNFGIKFMLVVESQRIEPGRGQKDGIIVFIMESRYVIKDSRGDPKSLKE